MTGEQKSWKLFSGKVLPSFEIAAASMKKGEFSCFLTTYKYNFGELGCPPRIPPESTILWEIKMEDWEEHAEVDDNFCLSQEDKETCSLDTVLKVTEVIRQEAKKSFNVENYDEASRKYRKAIQELENYHIKNNEEEKRVQKELIKLFLNTSVCFSKTSEYTRSVSYASSALDLNRFHVKGLYLKGKGLRQLSEFDKAKYFLLEAFKRKPNNAAIVSELSLVNLNIKKSTQQERTFCQKMFTALADGTSPEETSAENPKGTGQEKSDVLDPQFQKTTKTTLQEFAEDNYIEEMQFSTKQFTEAELDYIKDVASELKLRIKQIGKGNLKFVK